MIQPLDQQDRVLQEVERLRLDVQNQSAEFRRQVVTELERLHREDEKTRSDIVQLRIEVAVLKSRMIVFSVAGGAAIAAIVTALMDLILK